MREQLYQYINLICGVIVVSMLTLECCRLWVWTLVGSNQRH